MRKAVFIICLFIISQAALTQTRDWELKSDTNGVKVWMLKSNPLVTASKEDRFHKKEIDWKEIGSKDFFNKFENHKRRVLSLIGVKEWSADQMDWKLEKKGKGVLTVSGSYLDSSRRKIVFKEVHIYSGLKTTQILLTWPSDFKSGDDKANQMLKDLN